MDSLLVLLNFEFVFFWGSNVSVMFIMQNGKIPFFVFIGAQIINCKNCSHKLNTDSKTKNMSFLKSKTLF